MQIILNSNEASQAVLDYVRDRFNLNDDDNVSIDLNDDLTVHVFVNEEIEVTGTDSKPAGERRQKRPRRTKAQIEADREAEEAAKAESQQAAVVGNEAPTQTTSAEAVKPSEPAPAEDAGVVTQTEEEVVSTSPGTEAEPVAQTEPEPETQAEPEVQTEAPAEEQPVTKPAGVSLFANLRKPQNS